MRRWDPAIAYLGSGEYAPDMEESDDGEYVRYVGHSGAMHAAVRDTRRGMIAALYWQAGVYACGSVVAGENGYIERCRALAERADALRCTADAMEFPL